MKIKFILNGENMVLNTDPAIKLSTYLKDNKIITVKRGCDHHTCTSCTVLIDDEPVLSCLTSLAQCDNSKITTLEEFVQTKDFSDIKKGFDQAHVKMCGFCNAGKIFTAYKIIKTLNRPTKDEIRSQVSFFTCTCTETDSLVDGIYLAAAARRSRMEKKRNEK